jgi:PKD repeat protein
MACACLSLLLMLLVGACSGQTDLPSEQLPPLAGGPDQTAVIPASAMGSFLPDFEELERSASEITDLERIRTASDYNKLLPNNAVTNFGEYKSTWTTPADGLSKAAYACYSFAFGEAYSGDMRLRVGWQQAPADPGQLYLAVANWQSGRWQWFPAGSGEVSLGSVAPYLSPTNKVHCCLLLLGQQTAYFSYILLGDNLAPFVSIDTNLNADPKKNIGAQLVFIDASLSYAIGSEITGFDFDYDGDGTYDLTGNTDGTTGHFYDPGNYMLRVRVTETSGRQAVLDEEIVIVNPLNDPPVAAISSNLGSGPAPLQVEFNPAGSSDPDGYLTEYRYDFNDDGIDDLTTDDPAAVQHVLSAFGGNTVRLTVVDNFFAEDTDTVNVDCLTGWVYSTVDPSVYLYAQVSMAVCEDGANGRAAVAYVDDGADELRFCRAANSEGIAWENVRDPFGSLQINAKKYTMVDLAYSTVNAAPMLACITDDNAPGTILRLVSANDQTGASWKSPVVVPGISNAGSSVCLEIVNTLPALYTINNPLSDTDAALTYIQAKDPLAAAWNSPVSVETTPGGFGFAAIDMMQSSNGFFNYPLISYVRWNEADSAYDIFLRRASNVDGTAWDAADFVGQHYPHVTSLALVDGKPAIAAGNVTNSGQSHFARAADAKGQSWPVPVAEVGVGGYVSLGEWGGRPAICAAANASEGLLVHRAVNADGTAWETPIIVDKRSGAGLFCSMTVVNDTPVICYWNSQSQALLAAAWKN